MSESSMSFGSRLPRFGKLVAVVLALSLPAQAAAHCGVLLAGLYAHDHHGATYAAPGRNHHQHASSAELPHITGAVEPTPTSTGPALVAETQACSLAALLFTLKKDSDRKAFAQIADAGPISSPPSPVHSYISAAGLHEAAFFVPPASPIPLRI